MSLGVGKEILSYCSKCKLTLAHIITTMKDPYTPGKVTCKTCDAVHGFKDALKSKPKGGKRRKVTPKESAGEMWNRLVANSKSDTVKYSPKGSFEKDQILDHPKFGNGLIEKVIESNKLEVLFESGYKTLVHNLK